MSIKDLRCLNRFTPFLQLLTPMHRGIVGAENLNRRLQQTLNAQEA
ncbi:MAG: hypothetical protein PVH87_06590 [Desulfobacteraceae bacterium]